MRTSVPAWRYWGGAIALPLALLLGIAWHDGTRAQSAPSSVADSFAQPHIAWLARPPVGLVLSSGADVESVLSDGLADKAQIKAGDRMLQVDHVAVTSADAAAAQIQAALSSGKSAIDLVIQRNQRDYYIVLPLHR
jgi:S1-C subfamily serine protease